LASQYTYCFHSLNKALASNTANIFIKVHKHFWVCAIFTQLPIGL